jgi:hypothetical protein
MSDETEPVTHQEDAGRQLSLNRILLIMAVIGAAGTVAGFALVSKGFGTGLLIGVVLGFLNLYWMKRGVAGIIGLAVQGEVPGFLAARYFLRYLLLGLIVWAAWATRLVPVGAILLGMTTFAFAIVIEGFIQILLSIFGNKEI